MAYINNIDEINEILKNDGIIAFVTDTVWGLGCLPSSKKAVEKIYEIKHREAQKPLILMSSKVEYLKPYIKRFDGKVKELANKIFAGALTIVTEKSEKTPDYMTSNFQTVGIRIPDNAIFQELCDNIDGNVLATTSANLSHEPSAKTYEDAKKCMTNRADFIVPDYGFLAKGLESTVVLVNEDEVKILRQGEIKL